MNVFFKICILFTFTLLLSGCKDKQPLKGDLIDYIPEDVDLVLKISDLKTLISESNANDLLSTFKDEPLLEVLLDKKSIFPHLSPKRESVLCFKTRNDSMVDYLFLTHRDSTFVLNDSIESIIKKTAFINTKDSVFMAASSQQMIDDVIAHKTEVDPEFRRVFKVKKNTDLTAIYQNEHDLLNKDVVFASRIALDLSLTSNGISASGISLARDSIPQLLQAFQNQVPQQNDLELVIPNSAHGATSFTFSDASHFIENLKQFKNEDSSNNRNASLFESINEVGMVQLSEEKMVVLKSIDPSFTREEFAALISENKTYRDIVLYNFDASQIFEETFYPLIQKVTPTFVFQWEQFFVFTESEAEAENAITAIKNNDVLANTGYFEENRRNLSNASSLLYYAMKHLVSTVVSHTLLGNSTKNRKSTQQFPFAAIQYSYDRDFAHVNFVCLEASKKQQISGSISQLFTLELDNDISLGPQLFTNHRTNGKDVLVQDITNKLHLISSSGKKLWEKKLASPILGKIHEVDLLKNGKRQLAFATSKAFYVLDRNGNTVAPFPKKYKDEITQPLAVFDYDNKRNYRFVICQGNEVFMYDSKGKIVKGFNFKKTATSIVLPPQHIRLGNKDYIAIAESSGKLNLLSRVGKERVKVTKKFNFSKTPIAQEGKNFVVIDQDNKKHSISNLGKISSKQVETAGSYYFVTLGDTKVTLDDNLLRINGKLIELPFGIYTRPQIFNSNRRTYVAVVETQEKKIYLYNKSGNLKSGFPIYGASVIDLSSISSKKAPYIVTKGGSKEILLYSL